MLGYLYSLFVWPFQVCIETFYVLFMRVFGKNAGLTIIVSAFLLNILLMPFSSMNTLMSDGALGKRPHARKINLLFAAAKPYLCIFFYLFLFIASYTFLTNIFFDNSFVVIKDLSKPDGILGINLIPIVMLILSIAAIVIIPVIKYKKINLPSIFFAIFFLIASIIFYQAPSSVCLFGAVSAFFLCIRNTIDSMKHPSRWYRGIILLACAVLLSITVMRFNSSRLIISLFLGAAALFTALITIFINAIRRFFESPVFYSAEAHTLAIYRYSCIVLFLLSGIAIPLLLFSSSPAEFYSLGSMFGHTICQAASIFIIAAFFYWEFSSKVIHRLLIIFIPVITIMFLISCFVFPGNYGILTSNFVFENALRSSRTIELGQSVLAVLLSALIIFCLFLFKKFQWLKNGFLFITVSLAVISGINGFSIIKQLNDVKDLIAVKDINDTQVFTFSKTGENIFVLFLDRATGYSLPDALKLNPNLEESLDGFTWYPNTISYAYGTIMAYPAMMGGYEYRPLELNKRKNETLKDKVNEAIKVLPTIFGDAGYQVMITDPTYTNLSSVPNPSIFDGMKNVQARNIKGIFRERYNAAHKLKTKQFHSEFMYDVTLRFSLFRMLPPRFRFILYNNDNWFKESSTSNYTDSLDHFSNLLYLKDLCTIVPEGKTANVMMNETPHFAGSHNRSLELVSEPITVSKDELNEFGSDKNAVEYTYTFAAALSAVGDWCEWLKQEGIYDNTKIIVVSDHGYIFGSPFLSSSVAEKMNPLLLVKDFESHGALTVSDTFMTNADMPVIASSSLAAGSLGRVVNPFTGNELSSTPKEERIFVIQGSSIAINHKRDSLVIDEIWELKNQNIFDSENWVKAEIPE